jgi:hypothetical protein
VAPRRRGPVFATLAAQHSDMAQIVADSGIIDLHDRIADPALGRGVPAARCPFAGVKR